MFKHIKNLIQKIKNKIDSYGSITAEEFFCMSDGGNLKVRVAHIMAGYRERESMSRREAAIALGISPKELKAIEKAKITPNKDLIFKMHRVYGIPVKSIWKYVA
ncbi:helix-turn-helix domain-containing protein [Mucispirillum schaedleri]|uniref:helix-turn-helix domain-containing protein n=1 Tax=Mucispirillum schaedleri TaxID=248039 RepID=UPI001F578813|nr:helix-turn-helix transcriptional regulator [Mucispirillum schaedleri]